MTFETQISVLLRILWALGVCAAAIPLAGMWLKRRRHAASDASGALKLAGKLELAPGVLLVSVDSEDKRFLLSVNSGKTELLDTTLAPAQPAALKLLGKEGAN